MQGGEKKSNFDSNNTPDPPKSDLYCMGWKAAVLYSTAAGWVRRSAEAKVNWIGQSKRHNSKDIKYFLGNQR